MCVTTTTGQVLCFGTFLDHRIHIYTQNVFPRWGSTKETIWPHSARPNIIKEITLKQLVASGLSCIFTLQLSEYRISK